MLRIERMQGNYNYNRNRILGVHHERLDAADPQKSKGW